MRGEQDSQRCGGYCPARIKRDTRPLVKQAQGCFGGRGDDVHRAERAEVSEM